MQTRKFEIEWQLFKTFFKIRMPAKTEQEMRKKMEVAWDVYDYFIENRSRELAYNVINWVQGLGIAFKAGDPRKDVTSDALTEMSEDFEEGRGVDSEGDEAFERIAIEYYIRQGHKESPIYKEHISNTFDFNLLWENVNQNLDMALKWSKGNYVHNTLTQYITDVVDVAMNTFEQEPPAKVQRKLEKFQEKVEMIRNDPDSKITHKFLF